MARDFPHARRGEPDTERILLDARDLRLELLHAPA
jgi:hypothetical protein